MADLGSTATSETTPTRLEIVLGIDPGTRDLGYGAVVIGARGPRFLAAGLISVRDADVPVRLGRIRVELDVLLERLKPTVIVVEQAFAARNVQSALRIGEGRGVVLGCAAATGARIVQYPPAVAKKALVGNGGADKTQVARMVEQLLGAKVQGLPLDSSDALCLALAYIARARAPESSPSSSARRTSARSSGTSRSELLALAVPSARDALRESPSARLWSTAERKRATRRVPHG